MSRKGGVNESLSESFGSRWASKVKINAYYKTIRVFFLPCMYVNLYGDSQNQNMNLSFITHNRGTLIAYMTYWILHKWKQDCEG